MKALGILAGILAWIVVSSMVSALVQSWMMQCLWRWFLAREYGHGPSMGAWFGIATIVGFVVRKNASSVVKVEDQTVDEIVKETTTMWLACLVILGIAWCVGSFMGWVP